MILTVTLNPSVDHALFVEGLKLGDTNRVQRTEKDAGGKGVNLSRVVDELTGRTLATGFLGGGPGAYVRAVLDREGVPHRFLDVTGDTRVNFSVEDGSGRPPTTFNEKGPTISESDWTGLLTLLESLMPECRWLVAGGSLPPGAPPDAYGQLVALGRKRGAQVCIDAEGEPLQAALEFGADLVKPNASEAARFLGMPVETAAQAIEASRIFHELQRAGGSANPLTIVSMGAAGAVFLCGDELLIGTSPKVEAKSTIGSGDSLLAGFLWAESHDMEWSECLLWGMAAGAATASTDGAEIARLGVIQKLKPEAKVVGPAGIEPATKRL